MWLLEKLNYICGSQSISVGQHWLEDVDTKNRGRGVENKASQGQGKTCWPQRSNSAPGSFARKRHPQPQPLHSRSSSFVNEFPTWVQANYKLSGTSSLLVGWVWRRQGASHWLECRGQSPVAKSVATTNGCRCVSHPPGPAWLVP